MCRIAAYLGPPILVSRVVTEPRHSIIHQSYHSEERSEPLNGDGFGIGWFAPEISRRPAVFKDVTPAWNNENLLEIARVTVSPCIFAHVRAASPQSAVHRLNSHPFAHGCLAFMHNGSLAGFPLYRRKLLMALSDASFAAILGSTDSEHAFAILLDHYTRLGQTLSRSPVERLAESLLATIRDLEAFRVSAGVAEPSSYNFAVSDGSCTVVSRHQSPGPVPPPSLHYITGFALRCEGGHYYLDFDGEHNVVLIASERLGPSTSWRNVEPGHLLIATQPGRVQLQRIAE